MKLPFLGLAICQPVESRIPDAGVFNVGPVAAALRIVTLQGFVLLGLVETRAGQKISNNACSSTWRLAEAGAVMEVVAEAKRCGSSSSGGGSCDGKHALHLEVWCSWLIVPIISGCCF